MWHIKTKSGTFWILKDKHHENRYILGCNGEDLGEYDNIEQALKDIQNQETGYLKWDEQIKIKNLEDITQWEEVAPEFW